MRRVAYLAALAAMAAGLSGCQSLSEAAGLSKNSPDEFAVATKAPLIIPPNYNLKPPSPGAAPTNSVGPTSAAEGALYGTKGTISAQGQLSVGEQDLLTKADAGDADSMVRQRIAADNRAMQASDESFTNRILFGMGSDSSGGKGVDATAEAKRLDRMNPNDETHAPPASTGTTDQSDSGGFFDWLPF